MTSKLHPFGEASWPGFMIDICNTYMYLSTLYTCMQYNNPDPIVDPYLAAALRVAGILELVVILLVAGWLELVAGLLLAAGWLELAAALVVPAAALWVAGWLG